MELSHQKTDLLSNRDLFMVLEGIDKLCCSASIGVKSENACIVLEGIFCLIWSNKLLLKDSNATAEPGSRTGSYWKHPLETFRGHANKKHRNVGLLLALPVHSLSVLTPNKLA